MGVAALVFVAAIYQYLSFKRFTDILNIPLLLTEFKYITKDLSTLDSSQSTLDRTQDLSTLDSSQDTSVSSQELVAFVLTATRTVIAGNTLNLCQ